MFASLTWKVPLKIYLEYKAKKQKKSGEIDQKIIDNINDYIMLSVESTGLLMSARLV